MPGYVPADGLIPLSAAVEMLRQARRPRDIQSLRDRIKRGTMRGVRIGGRWYVYREDVERLAHEPYHPQGGRPRSVSESSAAYAQGRLAVDVDEVLRLASTPLAKRFAVLLEAQALLFGIKRAQLDRRFPKLSAAERVIKMFEELQDGEHFSYSHVLRASHPRAR